MGYNGIQGIMKFRVISWVLNRNNWCILDDITNHRPLFWGYGVLIVFLQMDANGRRRRGMLWYATCRLQVFQNVEGSVLTHWRFIFCWETRIDSNLDTLQGAPPILRW